MDEQKKDTYLSREESIEKIYELINSGFLNKTMEEDLQEIANLIQYELDGEHLWGQPYEADNKLRSAYREDLLTEELMEEMNTQHMNCRFIPCKNEIEDLRKRYYENRGIDETSNFSDRVQCEKDFIYYYGINPIS